MSGSRLKILIIDSHQPEYFWGRVADELKARGHRVTVAKTLLVDSVAYDVVIKVYLDAATKDVADTLGSVPVVAAVMGTDVIYEAYRGIDFRKVAKVMCHNTCHEELIKSRPGGKFARTHIMPWFADEDALTFAERERPEIVKVKGETKIKGLRLLAPALHTYNKGLDNLICMLSDCTALDMESTTLHIVGPVGDPYLNFYTADFCKGNPPERQPKAKFSVEYHGQIKPQLMDSIVESIQPHASITASQGEQGATTVLESMIKGLPALVLDHPFLDGAFKSAPIHKYYNASSLNKALLESMTTKDSRYSSKELRAYGINNHSKAKFVSRLETVLENVVSVHGGK